MTPDPRPRAGLRLASGHMLPDLRIMPRAQVHLHEDCDPARVEALSARLRDEGVLRNPPVAAPLPEGGYVVLDGANRASALAALEVPFIPLQVVDYHDPAVRLEVWHHLLTDAVDLAAALRAQGLPLRTGTRREVEAWLADRSVACGIFSRDGALGVPLSAGRLAATLSAVVGAYKATAKFYRVLTADLDELAAEYGTAGVVVVFKNLSDQRSL